MDKNNKLEIYIMVILGFGYMGTLCLAYSGIFDPCDLSLVGAVLFAVLAVVASVGALRSLFDA
jgi:hypothetical protein